ncbi:MAG: hypothetical protein IJA61_03650 [Clostridia bacterium]|nr:hypothetical protein [Clostridia bacterium]
MNKIIDIEGTDCSGKQTQSELLKINLEKRGFTIHQSGFPMYDTPTGRIVGNSYLGKDGNGFFPEGAVNVDRRVAGLYYSADRLYNLPKIQEMLKTGNVILDRYVDSNLAHQGAKILDPVEREKTYAFFETLEYGLLELPKPDIRVLLYMPTEYAKLLKAGREEKPDQHESDEEYLKRSENCYLEIAKRNNYHIIYCVKDGIIRTIEDIQQELLDFVISRL